MPTGAGRGRRRRRRPGGVRPVSTYGAGEDDDEADPSFFELGAKPPPKTTSGAELWHELQAMRDRDRVRVMEAIQERNGAHARPDYDLWFDMLSTGFNVGVHGLGSKRHVVETFADEFLGELPCIIISGYADVFCLSTLLSIIAARVADTSVTRRDPFKSARAIARALDDSQTDMYLVVHNLDGPRFRTPKIQTTLSILASSPRIRVLASIDHCRVPLLWDSATAGAFGFVYVTVDTLLPYISETANADAVLRQRRKKKEGKYDGAPLASVGHIMAVLTNRQNRALRELAVEGGARGLTFEDWREFALVHSEREFKTIVSDLHFHHLLRESKDPDTGALLYTLNVEDAVVQSDIVPWEEQ
ncbi:Origin recognition complex subunit 2 [Plasmodiophora brassicae]|uniref:Origin recognition complex subunit 2 n=1 Tax=Plasmodiophora brassicae TaxID=37360 RepID=A0A0G4IXD7_PLABS|nr:hypothetical protein PBRA_007508 [Plasmodiophora brassicae]SPQ97065.1 unnamed protein product [Plasmodiophora brassicae]